MKIKLYVATITSHDGTECFIDHQAISTELHDAEQQVIDSVNSEWKKRYDDGQYEGEWQDLDQVDFPFETPSESGLLELHTREFEVEL